MVKQLLFRLAKAPWMGRAVGLAFRHCAWAIPVKKVFCSRDILAFEHPRPAYPNHVIISPRKPVQTLLDMAEHAGDFIKVWDAVQAIWEQHPAYHDGFMLVANGGKRQEVQQVHFHLFTDHAMVEDCTGPAGSVVFRDDDVCVTEHPQPQWACHLVIQPAGQPTDAYFEDVLRCLDRLNGRYGLVQQGYSLVYQQTGDRACPVFHIVAGKRIN